MIAFVSSIIADIQGDYPNYSWWSLAFMLMCIVAVFVTVATDSVHTYHVALVGLLSAGLVFTTSSVNSLIYYSDAAKEAAAAGFILLSMVSVCCNQFSFDRHSPANTTFSRSYGSFTTARNRQQLTVALSTLSHCTRRAHLLAAADTCRKTPTDQTHSALAATNHKCTTPTSSLASKHHHPWQVSQEVQQVNRTEPQHQLSLHPLPPPLACLHPTQESQKVNILPSSITHTVRRQFTVTKPTPTTATRWLSPSTRFWKSQTSVDVGGKQRRRTERRESFPAIMFVCLLLLLTRIR